jgi:NhaP-type Na+/H+ and K+/H+ antiporter
MGCFFASILASTDGAAVFALLPLSRLTSAAVTPFEQRGGIQNGAGSWKRQRRRGT